MSSNDRMSGVLQENVLTVLCFDTESAKSIRAAVTPDLFESRVFQEIASHALTFLDQYGEAVRDHLPDLIEDRLNDKDGKKAALYKRTLDNLWAARDGINSQFVVTQIKKFVHEQTLKVSILKAVDHLEAGRIDEAEVVLEEGLNAQVTSFDIGTSFMDTSKSLAFFDKVDDGIPTGIVELDKAGIMPSPGTQFTFVAPAKKGKSWFLTHLGKMGVLQRKKTLIITLEMSEAQYSQRMVQALFSVSKRQARIAVPKFRCDERGTFVGVDFEDAERPVLGDAGVRAMIEKNISQKFKNRLPLIIKSFPTGTLTVNQYKSYLDQLERLHKFVPDLVLFDYPDLMQLDAANKRVETGEVFKQLRGVAVERNHALVNPTQGNRASAESRTTLDTHVAEDYSKIATSDTVVTYSQTVEEKRMGLARLYVANARADEDKFTVLITQAYGIGQFALDSRRMSNDYWARVDAAAGRAPVEDDE